MNPTCEVIHIALAEQPTNVRQLTDRLFGAYTLEGGKIHLAGCQLDDRYFLRLSVNCGDDCREMYLDSGGREVPSDLIAALGMHQTVRLAAPPRDAEEEIRQLAENGIESARRRLAVGDGSEPVQVAALWCKFAEGKLRFTFGDAAVDLPFADWARTLEAPPLVCAYTGETTFHLGATDDGRIVPADRIETCAETGRRVLADELVTCSATDKRVLRELVEECSFSGKPVLKSEMVECPTCWQRVSPAVVQRRQCAGCRNQRHVSKADPRMARLLDENPPLDRWRRWSMAETATVYILTATGWLKRLRVVVDKESLEIKALATGNRFTHGWQPVEPGQYAFVLRE